jgi:nucleolin
LSSDKAVLMPVCRFLLRRAAVRAISATPSKALLAKPRSIATFTPSTLRTHKQQWSIAFQRRFASDDAAKTEAAQAAAAEAPENFAQTAAEPPMEDGLTPAQQDAQAKPTDANATVGPDALEQAAKVADAAQAKPGRARDNDVPPHKMLYIGNLYYEVTAEQLKNVFSRFGDVESVKIVYDNRGLSRGYVDRQQDQRQPLTSAQIWICRVQERRRCSNSYRQSGHAGFRRS